MEDKTPKPQRVSLFPYLLLGCVGLLILIQVYQGKHREDGTSLATGSGDSTSSSSRDADVRSSRLSSRSDSLTEQIREQLQRKTAEYAELKAENVELERQILALQGRLTNNSADGGKPDAGKNEELAKQMAALSSSADSELKAFQDELERQASAFIEQQLKVEREQSKKQIADLESKHRDELANLRDSFEQEIEDILEDGTSFQYSTARAFVRVGASAVPALTDALRDNSASVRTWSAYVLGEVGSAARAAVPALIEAQSDSNENVRAAATRALMAIEESENR